MGIEEFEIRENRGVPQGRRRLTAEREAYAALVEAGFSYQTAARIVGVNYRTTKRWRAGQWSPPGRSGKAYSTWLEGRGPTFRDNVKIAALDPFAGYKTAIDDQLEDATAVLDAFHVVKLGTAALDEVRRRVQQNTLGHRGRKGDPLFGIQTILLAGAENLTDKQRMRLVAAFETDPANEEVFTAWQCAQQLRSAYHSKDLAKGRRIAEKVLDSFHSCPIPEIARLGKTLRRWRDAFLAYFTHESSEQRRHRSRERHHRTPPPPRPRLPQPPQLPTPHAPRRRQTHPITPT